MVEAFSLILGSVLSLLGLKAGKIAYKTYPYFLKSKVFTNSQLKTLRIGLISGSTDGLGKSFANKLFKQGSQLILIGRSNQKLCLAKNELESSKANHNTCITNYNIDFSKLNSQQIQNKINELKYIIQSKIPNQLTQNLNKIQIYVINSCGQAHISPYSSLSLDQIQKLNAINLNSFHLMSNNQQNPNRFQYFFINVSSGVDILPNRYSSIYSGSKAYFSNIMKVLHLQNNENKTKDQVYFLNLTPLYIQTKMIKYLDEWDVSEPDKIVNGAFKLLKRKTQGAGSLTHQILKQLNFIVKNLFIERVQKAWEIKKRISQIQKKRKQRKNKLN